MMDRSVRYAGDVQGLGPKFEGQPSVQLRAQISRNFAGMQGVRGGGQLGGAATNATVQQPILASISVQTSVSVPDGGTVLLGGIKRLREGRNMAGVPILNKIPYISRLFKNSGVGRETESIMLMVTPRIVIHEEEQELLGIPVE